MLINEQAQVKRARWGSRIVGVAVASMLITAAGCSPSTSRASRTTGVSSTTTKPTSPPAELPSSSTTSPGSEVFPTSAGAPAGFIASSVSFISDSEGWVLGTYPCGTPPCTSLLRTTDGGNSWTSVPAPYAAVNTTAATGAAEIHFSDLSDGYAFGGSALWITHDGGSTWQDQAAIAGISPYVVGSLVSTSTGVYALVAGYSGERGQGAGGEDADWRLVRASATSDSFSILTTLTGSPGVPFLGELSVAGGAVYAIDGTSILRAQGTSVVTNALPANQNCEGPLAVSSATDVLLACGRGVADGSFGSRALFGTVDSGMTWTRLPDPGPGDGYDTFGVADGGSGHAAIATVNGGGSGLLVTVDYGENWTLMLNFPGDSAAGFGDLAYEDATHAVVIHGPAAAERGANGSPFVGIGDLYRTTDGGQHWAKVNL